MGTPHERLKRAREEAGFDTAREAASAFDWNEQTYYSHESGKRGFHDDAERYSRAFKVSIEWLLTGRGQNPDKELRELIADYRSLTDSDRQIVARLVADLRAARERGRE